MIPPQTRFLIARVPLARIVVTENQPRFPDRALHYVRLLSEEWNAASDAGMVHLAFYGMVKVAEQYSDCQQVTHATAEALWTLLDGHHRYVGSILAGRAHVLAIIELQPGQPGYDDALEALAMADLDLVAVGAG